MHQNLAIILRQFNYSKNLFIVLVPGAGFDLFEHNNETNSSHKQSFCNLVDLIFYLPLLQCDQIGRFSALGQLFNAFGDGCFWPNRPIFGQLFEQFWKGVKLLYSHLKNLPCRFGRPFQTLGDFLLKRIGHSHWSLVTWENDVLFQVGSTPVVLIKIVSSNPSARYLSTHFSF